MCIQMSDSTQDLVVHPSLTRALFGPLSLFVLYEPHLLLALH